LPGKDNNDEISIETIETQNAITLSVLYNSDYINGKQYLDYVNIFKIAENYKNKMF